MAWRRVTFECPLCRAHDTEAAVMHDAGVWRTTNGDGWPETWEVEWADVLHPDPSDADYDIVADAAITAYQNGE